MKVAIIGSALSGNKGAAAMLESSIQTITKRAPGTEFVLYSMYPAEDSKQNSYDNLQIIPAKPLQLGVTINLLALLYRILPPLRDVIYRKSTAIRELADSDILLDQGGITFVDGREKFLLYNIASILPALMLRVPVFKCAQASGPFENPINRAAAKLFLPRVHTIVARGEITYKYLTELGLKNVIQGADYAFALDVTTSEKSLANDEIADIPRGKKGVVALSPSVVMQKKAAKSGKDYAAIMVGFIGSLTADGYSVVLLPHSARSSEATHNNDLPLCRDIYDSLASHENVKFIDRELDSQILRAIIGNCDYLVASRFHAMVSGLAMQVPTLVIGWSHKYKEVLDMFELSDYAFSDRRLNTHFLKTQFDKLVADRKDVLHKLHLHLPEVRDKSSEQAQLIVETMTRKV